MAKMIPDVPHPDCKSPGEIDIFNRLKTELGTEDWTVLHSLSIVGHLHRVEGELDFVIIVPQLGVLCVEVKACNSLRIDARGAWYYGSDPAPDRRGPFRQASEAMHSLRKWVGKLRPDLARTVFWTACIFPRCPLPAVTPEWHPWQVIDNRTYGQRPLGDQLRHVLIRARARLEGLRAPWFRPEIQEPTPEQCGALTQLLRPQFEAHESAVAWARRVDGELRRFTEDQYRYVRAAGEHPRLLVRGPAGSGKTFLAIETAKREAQWPRPQDFLGPPRGGASGHILLACYTRLLGAWLKEAVKDVPGIKAGTLHRHMMDVCGMAEAPPDAGEDFWSRELPGRALDRLLETPGPYQLDALVIDEAQDLLAPTYLEFLDLSLKGGLAEGRWAFFGDFERQAIHASPEVVQSGMNTLLQGKDVARLQLRENCRNTPRIAALVQLLGGLEPGYDRVLRPDDQVDHRIERYSTLAEQRQRLLASMDRLLVAGLREQDIVVLSPRADDSSVAGLLHSAGHRQLRPLRKSTSAGGLGFGTIHAFKGLEARAVILTDIEEIADLGSQALLYVGVTRAQNHLTILMNNSLREQVVSLLTTR
ncbi:MULTISPECIES: nuclease-related domain-containing DEAD/DEAH box helicase [Myxococcus]|uniref:nuclease-related domain-containing DEAD/DEAH box helicase n=1 Tax=Myxococcus TaxID=32 RepID=UPI001141E03B|nr:MULTISPECIES: NERD domain-containing protein [Myxococcus]NOK00999.1 ATP-binding domain-containing protein [Myxococcus xanthus]